MLASGRERRAAAGGGASGAVPGAVRLGGHAPLVGGDEEARHAQRGVGEQQQLLRRAQARHQVCKGWRERGGTLQGAGGAQCRGLEERTRHAHVDGQLRQAVRQHALRLGLKARRRGADASAAAKPQAAPLQRAPPARGPRHRASRGARSYCAASRAAAPKSGRVPRRETETWCSRARARCVSATPARPAARRRCPAG